MSRLRFKRRRDRSFVAFMNAALNARGSIIQKHTVLTWVTVIKKLKDEDGLTYDPSAILQEFNTNYATGHASIVGTMRVGVLNMLNHCIDGL